MAQPGSAADSLSIILWPAEELPMPTLYFFQSFTSSHANSIAKAGAQVLAINPRASAIYHWEFNTWVEVIYSNPHMDRTMIFIFWGLLYSSPSIPRLHAI